MKWRNSCLISGELFLDLELAMYGKIRPTPQTLLNLSEIIELVVLKDSLLIPTVDFLVLINALNWDRLQGLGAEEIDWEHELINPGKGRLRHPMFLTLLDDEGVLVHSVGSQDKEYEELGNTLFHRLQKGKWRPKTPAMMRGQRRRETFELRYVRGFNEAFRHISSNPLYWKLQILAAPYAARYYKERFGVDLSWAYQNYIEAKLYVTCARKRNLGFSHTILMQPFVALNHQPSKSLVQIFYDRLKDLRDKQIKRLLELQEPWTHTVPPLTSILLQRCKTREELPTELIRLREEFKSLRESLATFQKQSEEAETLKEKLELRKDFQNSLDLFTRRAKVRRKRIMKTLIDFALEQTDSLARKDLGGPISVVAGKIADHIWSKKLYPWVNSFLDLYNRSLDIRLDTHFYEGLFGEINLNHLSEFELFARNSVRLLKLYHTARRS